MFENWNKFLETELKKREERNQKGTGKRSGKGADHDRKSKGTAQGV